MKKRILIFYSYFNPAFKAGGPVQSLVNLVENLKESFEFFVFTGAFEMGESEVMPGIQPDTWNQVEENIQVYYAKDSKFKTIKEAVRATNPDIIYVNGLFVPFFSLMPLYVGRKNKINTILAPRGMVQQGALAVKPLKKRVFLEFFRLFGFHRNLVWHATDDQEQNDIRSIFGVSSVVKIAPNIPKAPVKKKIGARVKEPGQVRLIFLSLITEKKNLHILLSALNHVTTKVILDIYGPIKDKNYWSVCQSIIAKSPHQIEYKGVVNPNDVQATFDKYHVFILPTKGENFGHAIYESLSVGVPAIISKFTPWRELQTAHGGITVDTFDEERWSNAIEQFLAMGQDEYNNFSEGAHAVAEKYFDREKFRTAYLKLFEA